MRNSTYFRVLIFQSVRVVFKQFGLNIPKATCFTRILFHPKFLFLRPSDLFTLNRTVNQMMHSHHSFDIWIIVPFFNGGIHNSTSDFSKKSMKFLCYFKITRDYLYPLTRENLEQKGFYSFLNIVSKYVMIVSRRFLN